MTTPIDHDNEERLLDVYFPPTTVPAGGEALVSVPLTATYTLKGCSWLIPRRWCFREDAQDISRY